MARRDRTPRPIYGPDLAFIHDAGFGAIAAAAARRIEAHLATHRVPDGALVDLGCGSGALAAALAKLGRPIIGIDVSPAMIALAREAAPDARFEVGSVYTAPIPKAAIVTAVGETFNYLLPGARIPPLDRVFHRVARALVPGGLFLLDLVTGPAAALAPRQAFRAERDWAVLAETRATRSSRRLERRIVTFRRVGATYRRTEEVHRIQIHSRREALTALRAAGFRVRVEPHYDESIALPGRTVLVATKR